VLIIMHVGCAEVCRC